MPHVGYRMPGVPPGPAKGASAFMPPFQPYCASGAQQYKYALVSYLGRVAIPMQARRDTQISPDPGDKAQMGYARSSDAPDAIWPQKSFQYRAVERPGMPIAYYSPTRPGRTTLLPVPAEDYRALYQRKSARLSRVAILNRVRQLPWWPRTYRAPDGSGNSTKRDDWDRG